MLRKSVLLARHLPDVEHAQRRFHARTQRAEDLPDRPGFMAARYRGEHARGMISERCRKGDLFLRGWQRDCKIGGAKAVNKLPCQRRNRRRAILRARLDDVHQRRPAERFDPQEARAKRRPRLALEARRVQMRKGEGAGYGPLAGLRRGFEQKRIGVVQPDGSQ